jgi:thioredoxin 1
MVGMIRVLATILTVASLCGAAQASTSKGAENLPFNEAADPQAEIRAAMTQAAAEKKYVLLIFGANWCIDCRELSANMVKSPLSDLIRQRYVVVKVDVGNWNKNLDVVKAWGDPIAKGIPGVVVADPNGSTLYMTKAGEVANARWMGSEGLMKFFYALPQSRL